MTKRLRLTIRGAVQGVGFRPFVYRLASELGLKGWVNNSSQGVFIEVEGTESGLHAFLLRVETEKPPRSSIQSLESSWLDALGYRHFEIRESDPGGPKITLVLPDISICPDCLHEIFDPKDRRYFYPFTNCTNCGPRFSIIESLPYDRANTSMKKFSMCPRCQAEYDNPLDRRFHAQPNACPTCGPHVELWDTQGRVLPSDATTPPSSPGYSAQSVLTAAADAIRSGQIVAIKGLGGFHLMTAAHNDDVVRLLRERKHREEKPLALMFPSLQAIQSACEVSPFEERLLRSPEAPIVLLRRLNHGSKTLGTRTTHHAPRTEPPSSAGDVPFHVSRFTFHVSPLIAPSNPFLGVMLPYTPLHHLLLSLLGFPVVATSGNLSDEPICTDEHEALERLTGIADLFLVHNRPVVRHVDDSIVRFMAGREMVIRRARGYAPLPVRLSLNLVGDDVRSPGASAPGTLPASRSEKTTAPSTPSDVSILAVGAHLKNTVAFALGGQAFISQHIGDLETDQSYEAFRRVITDFERLYETRPSIIAADAHPDYLSTKFARELTDTSQIPKSQPGLAQSAAPRLTLVQHHVAHVLSCMAENELKPPVLGVSWDGTGYGLDGSVWGGEFFLISENSFQRVAHLRQFRLPGGDQAIKEPRRTALGLLHEAFGEAVLSKTDLVQSFTPAELAAIKTMLARKLNSPLTSSAGRLFDAISALVGLRQQVRFEGQAAMELEFALDGIETDEHYPLSIVADDVRSLLSPLASLTQKSHAPASPCILDWAPLVQAVLDDMKKNQPIGLISARFHNGLVEAIVALAQHFAQERIALSGGCFQNRYLTEHAVQRLTQAGFRPYWHQRVPPNDGGISLGQIVAALHLNQS